MSSQAALGQTALNAKKYEEAVNHLSHALQTSRSPVWLIDRSTAYNRTNAHELSLRDAEEAYHVALGRGKRELMAQAQMRRAIALLKLNRIGDARMCFTYVRKLNEKEKGLGMWQQLATNQYEKLAEDAEERMVSIKEVPDKPSQNDENTKPSAQAAAKSTAGNDSKNIAATETQVAAQTPKEKIRHEWFQSASKISITVFAKGVPKDKADIEIGPQSLEITFPVFASNTSYNLSFLPLFGKVDVNQSTFSITANKIEVSLHKAVSGLKWAALEGSDTTATDTNGTAAAPQRVPAPAPADKAPSYPTSSRKGVKDWDAVAKDALRKEKNGTAKDGGTEKAEADDDDDIEEGDPLNGFFKKLYKDANPDTRRAMMKSYTESNGTALSTDWSSVGKGKVETSPPDGLEAKKW